MASFCIQFHATINDLVDFVHACLTNRNLHAVAVYTPFEVKPLRPAIVREVLSEESVHSVVFTVGNPVVSATTSGQLLDANEGCLVLDIGRLRGRSLEESCLNTTRASPLWKKAAADLRRRTTAGATGVHEVSGASVRYRAHRFTPEARALSEQGVALRQFVTSPVVLRPSF